MSATTVIQAADGPSVARRAAAMIDELIVSALAQRGVAHVALAGGTTPASTYELLALPNWQGVELWFGDERCVEPEDPESNYRMVATTLLPHTPGAIVHRIEAELGAEPAARIYDEHLHARLPLDASGTPVFDLVLLGIGEDGHTASLFPNSPELERHDHAVLAVHGAPKPPPDRVSLSLAVLRSARRCILLASGSGKAQALAAALAPPSAATPSSLLNRDRLTVIADAGALSALASG
jgi:6-phosphogluconolactonase